MGDRAASIVVRRQQHLIDMYTSFLAVHGITTVNHDNRRSTADDHGLSDDDIRKFLKTRSSSGSGGGGDHHQSEEVCAVCLDSLDGNVVVGVLDCGHEFHQSCITLWLVRKNFCPLCKAKAIGIY